MMDALIVRQGSSCSFSCRTRSLEKQVEPAPSRVPAKLRILLAMAVLINLRGDDISAKTADENPQIILLSSLIRKFPSRREKTYKILSRHAALFTCLSRKNNILAILGTWHAACYIKRHRGLAKIYSTILMSNCLTPGAAQISKKAYVP